MAVVLVELFVGEVLLVVEVGTVGAEVVVRLAELIVGELALTLLGDRPRLIVRGRRRVHRRRVHRRRVHRRRRIHRDHRRPDRRNPRDRPCRGRGLP